MLPKSRSSVTNGFVQLVLIATFYASATYNALFLIASAAIIVPYVLSGGYALKLALTGEGYKTDENRTRDIIIGLVATTYGVWLLYAAGFKYLFLCAILYAFGILVHLWVRSERGEKAFNNSMEWALAVALGVGGLAAAYLLWTGALTT